MNAILSLVLTAPDQPFVNQFWEMTNQNFQVTLLGEELYLLMDWMKVTLMSVALVPSSHLEEFLQGI